MVSIGPAAGRNFLLVTIRSALYGLGYDLALALGRTGKDMIRR